MEYEFTAGAHRAIARAAGWSLGREGQRLEAPALLLGLLGETECRASAVLEEHGVDAAGVRRRWPALRPLERPAGETDAPSVRGGLACEPPTQMAPFSAEVEAALALVVGRFKACRRPVLLATEHLLLGLAAAEHEAAIFLREHGVDPNSLEAEIHRHYGPPLGSLPPADGMPANVSPVGAPEPPSSRPFQAASRAAGDMGLPSHAEVAPHERVNLLRVLDAAANRGREGLRVVEDYVRFVLDDRHLTEQLKRLRHSLVALLSRLSISQGVVARETQADVGTGVTVASEQHRQDTAGVLAANFTRLQESLRTLEEFAKVLDPDVAAEFERLRYRSYTLHRAVEITRNSGRRLGHARLYVLIDGCSSLEQFAALARSLVDAGAHVIQLRDKTLDDRRLLQRARLLGEITRPSRTLFIVNDRPDLAVLARADGVHVGQQEVAVKDARTIVGLDALIGVSTHSIQQARQAVLDGADYIGIGPTFPSATKHFDQFPGLELLRAVGAEIRLPAFAIGGITRDNLPQVLSSGVRRIAVRSAVTAADPAGAVRELLAMLEG